MRDEDGLVLVIDPAISRADIPVLCAWLAGLPQLAGGLVICDVSAIVDATAVVVDALARLRLTARRRGADIRVQGASPALCHLLTFTGLDEIVLSDGGPIPVPHGSARVSQRQAEQREQPLDIEKVGDTADPSA